MLTPVAVKTELQRQHISKELLEYGLEKAKDMGLKVILFTRHCMKDNVNFSGMFYNKMEENKGTDIRGSDQTIHAT